MIQTILSASSSTTRPASPAMATGIDIQVFPCIGMALRAVRPPRFVMTTIRISAPCVLSVAYNLQVRGIHASAIAAKMVKLSTIRNRSRQAQETETVAGDQPSLRSAKYGVAVPLGSRPLPAAIRQDSHLKPEATRQARIAESGGSAKLRLHGEGLLSVPMPPGGQTSRWLSSEDSIA